MRKRNVVLVVTVALLIGVFALRAADENLYESSGPQDVFLSANPPEPVEPEREGFCEWFNVTVNNDTDLVQVPVGKYFVLLKIYTRSDLDTERFELKIDDNSIIDGDIICKSVGGYQTMHEFPDECVVVNGGGTLRIYRSSQYWLKIQLIGYFCDE